MELIKSHAYQKFSCTIVNKEFQKMSEDLREQFALCAYSLAGRSCEKYARKWAMEEWRSCPEMVIALVFEAGDRGQGKLKQKLIADSGHIPPTFRPKKDTLRDDGMIEPGFVPLQAGDWLAWEINRATKDAYDGKLKSVESLRWPMREFLGCPLGRMGIYEPRNVTELETGLDLQNKISAWATAAGLDKKAASS
jgi:hypothetical protein